MHKLYFSQLWVVGFFDSINIGYRYMPKNGVKNTLYVSQSQCRRRNSIWRWLAPSHENSWPENIFIVPYICSQAQKCLQCTCWCTASSYSCLIIYNRNNMCSFCTILSPVKVHKMVLLHALFSLCKAAQQASKTKWNGYAHYLIIITSHLVAPL